ncbi:hypothetical protein ACYOEI_38515 [Singulisphaera rosea]
MPGRPPSNRAPRKSESYLGLIANLAGLLAAIVVLQFVVLRPSEKRKTPSPAPPALALAKPAPADTDSRPRRSKGKTKSSPGR